jgi:hypothetical protein
LRGPHMPAQNHSKPLTLASKWKMMCQANPLVVQPYVRSATKHLQPQDGVQVAEAPEEVKAVTRPCENSRGEGEISNAAAVDGVS